MARDWEQVGSGIARFHVPGGWLYFVQSSGYGASSAACFVPDKDAGKNSNWRGASIDELNLPARAHNCLVNDRIDTIGKLIARRDWELLRLPHFGRKTLAAIKEALDWFYKKEGINIGDDIMEDAAE